MTIATDVWTPVRLGDVTVNHRIVLAPLTRGRASPSSKHERTWVPNQLMEQYYLERATPGGLMISEACPVSIRASGLPGIPGWFTEEQQASWKRIVDGVHAKSAVFFAQLWHQGRNTHSLAIGQQPESSSDVPIDGSLYWSGMPIVPFEAPRPMTLSDIEATQDDFVNAAVAARLGGCDGVELHGGNGYLFDQFLHSNINLRDDDYGGTLEKRCRFLLETVDKVAQAIGSGRLGVRLTPFGLFNQTLGEDRVEQWVYLCGELAKRKLAYVYAPAVGLLAHNSHLIEPRFDEFKSASEKALALGGVSAESEMSLAPFREALGTTKVIVAGGYGPDNFQQGIESGAHDLVAFGRFFVYVLAGRPSAKLTERSNPDLVERLRQELPLYKWDRSRFYGPFPDNEVGYTVHTKRELASSLDALKPQLAD